MRSEKKEIQDQLSVRSNGCVLLLWPDGKLIEVQTI